VRLEVVVKATAHSASRAFKGALVIDAGSGLGVGRLRDVKGAVAFVEYFDHPGDGGTNLYPVDVQDLRRARLAPQTRVHVLVDGEWRHGRVIEHETEARAVLARLERQEERVLAEADVRIRWRRRLVDATPLLAALSVESRRFYDGRSRFVHAYLRRAAAYQRITALSSSSIELHPHQVEAARRVLSDVTQRYLLADEVGLGKTIEAGILIRQHLLDNAPGSVLVVVPPALTSQWQRELAEKLRLEEQFPGRVDIVAFDDVASVSEGGGVGLLVVDEAHRIAAEANVDDLAQRRFDSLASVAHGVAKVILLSATPLLQESASLLRLLHLLSPNSYRLDDLPAFEAMLQSRDEIGTLYANLDAEAQPAFLGAAVEGLRSLLAQDVYGISLLDPIDLALTAGDKPELVRAVRRARAYLGEAYRMYGRMIRTRRAVGLAEEFPVLGRLTPTPNFVGRDPDVGVAIDVWREHLAARLEDAESGAAGPLSGVREVLEAASGAGDALGAAVRRRLETRDRAPDRAEEQVLADLAAASARRAADCPRLRRATELALESVASARKVAVAVGSEDAAGLLVDRLRAADGDALVIQITAADPEAADRFSRAPGGAILVFGPTGEEGQNLQATEFLIHADLPWSPNRIEQRLGRFDRFGPGEPAEQVVLLEGEEGSLGDAWFSCLRDGFGVFSGSIASLQLVVDELIPEIVHSAILEGPPGLIAASDRVAQRLDDELQRIELAELLDETTADEQGLRLIEDTEEADAASAAETWAASVVAWASGDDSDAADLRFHHEKERNEHRFALTRFDHPDVQRVRMGDLPLIPHDLLADRFTGAVDGNGVCRGAFRRLTSARREIRLLGPGDPFVDALWAFTEEDDRGRAFATWRPRSAWSGRADLLAFCFDLRVYPDISAAMETLPWEAREPAESAIRRRAESYLPPVQERVWLEPSGGELNDPLTLALLEEPHAELRGDATIRPWLWPYVDQFVPRTDWATTCARMRENALKVIATRHELTDRCAHASARLRADGDDAAARIQARREPDAVERATSELALVEALSRGVGSPLIDVDVAGIVILASEPIPPEELR
jgi:ATP-dependent helicase HepA